VMEEPLSRSVLDMRKTKQIVYNLLSNAVKFSPSGGRVVMTARRVGREAVGVLPGDWPSHGFPLVDSAHAEFIEIVVSDGGIGISQGDMTKLFLAFSQIDSSLARQFEGTGLGLAMVKQLAELHDGAVAVSSAVGEGTHFAVWLPVLAPQAVANAPTSTLLAPRATQSPFGLVALVVEDDDAAADLVRLLLEAEGFVTVRATSAEQALAIAPQHHLSLITLDIRLPGMDGWEFLGRIRGLSALATVPVVVVAGEIDASLAIAAGAAAILQKPISRAELRASLASQGLHENQPSTRTVLIVDDDPKAVELAAAFLPLPAYAVVRAYGGAEAIVLAQRLRPDLILLDLMMPEVSGLDVVEALRQDSSTSEIPVLVVTAKQVTAAERRALEGAHGSLRIIGKAGFDRQAFMAEVRRAVTPILRAS
jgi:CheY-like chemotaxis protein